MIYILQFANVIEFGYLEFRTYGDCREHVYEHMYIYAIPCKVVLILLNFKSCYCQEYILMVLGYQSIYMHR